MFDDISSDVVPAPSSNADLTSSDEDEDSDESNDDIQFSDKPCKNETSKRKEDITVDDVSY